MIGTNSINSTQTDIEEGLQCDDNKHVESELSTDESTESETETQIYIQQGNKCINDKDEHIISTKEEDKPTEEGRYSHVLIPPPTGYFDNNDNKESRKAPMFCAVCLSEYEKGETISWSMNEHCTHVFHTYCVIEWFVANGRKQSSMQRFPDNPSKEKLLNYQLDCPCCRQSFVILEDEKT